jgi:hypothetical protein
MAVVASVAAAGTVDGGIATDGTFLYVAGHWTNNTVWKLRCSDLGTDSFLTDVVNLTDPDAITYMGGFIYVHQGMGARIAKINAATMTHVLSRADATHFDTGFQLVNDGTDIYWADRTNDIVSRIEVAGLTISASNNGAEINNPDGMTFGDDGMLYMITDGGTRIVKITPATMATALQVNLGAIDMWGIADKGDYLYISTEASEDNFFQYRKSDLSLVDQILADARLRSGHAVVVTGDLILLGCYNIDTLTKIGYAP